MLRLSSVLHILLLVLCGHCFPFPDEGQSQEHHVLGRDTAAANTSANSSNRAVHFQNTPLVKGVCTSTAVVALLLTLLTYWIVIRYTAPLSNCVLLPWSAIENLVFEVIQHAWIPKIGDEFKTQNQYPCRKEPRLCSKFGLNYNDMCVFNLNLGHIRKVIPKVSPKSSEQSTSETSQIDDLTKSKMAQEWFYIFPAQGMEDSITPCAHANSTEGMVWENVRSPALRVLVQLTIWEAISFWLAFLMVISTVVYNGFATGNTSSDGNLRLFLVGMYALTHMTVFSCTHYLHMKMYGHVIAHASLVILSNTFVFANRIEYNTWSRETQRVKGTDRVWPLSLRGFRFALLGGWRIKSRCVSVQIEAIHPFTVYADFWDLREFVFAEEEEGKRGRKAYFKEMKPEKEKPEDETLKSIWDSEIKGLEKALESGLEKSLAHIITMLGIILSTGLAPYTSVGFEQSNAVQLGSYALLLAVATGVTALSNCAIHATNAQESLRLILRLQEHVITATNGDSQFNRWERVPNGVGLTERIRIWKTIRDAITREAHGLRRLGFYIFGLGLLFLPSRDQLDQGVSSSWSHPETFGGTELQFSSYGGLTRLSTTAKTANTANEPATSGLQG